MAKAGGRGRGPLYSAHRGILRESWPNSTGFNPYGALKDDLGIDTGQAAPSLQGTVYGTMTTTLAQPGKLAYVYLCTRVCPYLCPLVPAVCTMFPKLGGTHLSLPQPSTGFLCLPRLGGCLSRLASRLLPGSMVSHLTTGCDKGTAQSRFVQPTKGHFCSVLGASHRLDMPGRPQPGGGTSLGNPSPALAGTWGLGIMPATGFPGSWTHSWCLLSLPMWA